jgi:hypothetical protein
VYTHVPYVLYTSYTCAHPNIMFNTALIETPPRSHPPTNGIRWRSDQRFYDARPLHAQTKTIDQPEVRYTGNDIPIVPGSDCQLRAILVPPFPCSRRHRCRGIRRGTKARRQYRDRPILNLNQLKTLTHFCRGIRRGTKARGKDRDRPPAHPT